VTKSTTAPAWNRTKTYRIEFDSVSAKSYQPQVVMTAAPANSVVAVFSITHTFTPYIASTEQVRTDAEAETVEKLNPSGQLVTYLALQGQVPMWLEPGLNFVYLHVDDLPALGYTRGTSTLTRNTEVVLAYSPRYYHS
jgi:hypothetical protein